MLELEATLSIGDDGFLYRDIFSLPPDRNPLIAALDGVPGYDRWISEYSGRREQSRGRLVQMERDGVILSASDVAL